MSEDNWGLGIIICGLFVALMALLNLLILFEFPQDFDIIINEHTNLIS